MLFSITFSIANILLNEAKWNLGKVKNKANAAILQGQVGGPERSAEVLPCPFAGVCSASWLACYSLPPSHTFK